MYISGLKFDGEGVSITHYRREKGVKHNTETDTSTGVYAKSLANTVSGLLGVAGSARKLPKAWVDAARVSGFSVQYSPEDKRMSVVVKMTVTVEGWGSSLSLNPRVLETELNDMGRKLLNDAIAEAKAFVDGSKRVDPELDLKTGTGG